MDGMFRVDVYYDDLGGKNLCKTLPGNFTRNSAIEVVRDLADTYKGIWVEDRFYPWGRVTHVELREL